MRASLSLLLVGLILSASDAHAREKRGDAFALRAARIYTASGQASLPDVIEDGTILVENGRITAIGKGLAIPLGVEILDLGSAVIIPGLVAATTGLLPEAGGDESVGAQYRAADEYDPFGDFEEVLANGVTTAHLSPGRKRLLSGTGAVVRLGPAGSMLDPRSDLCVQLSDDARRPPPLTAVPFPSSWDQEIRPAEAQMPQSRMTALLELDHRIAEARALSRSSDDVGPRAASLRELRSALEGKVPFRIEAREASDLAMATRWLSERGFVGYLVLADEVDSILDAVRAARLPVVLHVEASRDSLARDVGPRPDDVRSSARTALRLHRSGVPFALCGDPDASPPRLLLDAAAAVAEGLPELVALEAITRRPAEILGVDDEVGSLLPGRRADLVVLSGEPFATTTSVVRVFVGGEESLASRSDAVVVKAGTVLTGDGTRLDGGAVLIEDGKIVAVGRTVPRPPGCRVIDGGEESYLTPGLIDAHGHLGLEGDRSAPPTDIALWQTVGVAREDFVRVARSGVTTVLLAPYSASPRGSQVAAIKTWGMDRDDLVLRGLAGVFFSPRENDPLLDARALEGALKAGKAYHDQWVKYEEALKKWEEEQKKKKEEETRKKAEAANGKDAAKPAEDKKDAPEKKAPEEKPDDKKEEKPVEEVKKVADPLSGRWDVTLSGGPLPEPQKGTMHLKLEGNLVNGKMTSPFGDEVMVTGTLNGTRVVLEIDMETPFGAPRLEAEIDREDHMTGKLAVGPLNLDFEGTRVEKDIGEIKVTRKKKQEGEDGKPVAPDRKEDLEPFRALLTGKIPALVAATRAPWLLAYAKLFAEYKASLVFLGATAADEVQSTLAEQKIGVVLPTQEEIRRGRKLTPIGDLYARAGLEVAFQSDAEDGARALRAGAIMAVHRGMDASAALTALTAAPARLFKIDDRVGMLEKGRDGDLVLFSGPPLESGSRILAVLVNGKEVIEP